MIKNMVGLEFEYFLVEKSDNSTIVIPPSNFDTDDFCLLGEERITPADNPSELVANFYKHFYKLCEKIDKAGYNIYLPENGYVEISNELYKKVLKMSGAKESPKCENIYGTDIEDSSDIVIDKETGKILCRRVSNGLHIHFSSAEIDAKDVVENKYTPVVIPVSSYLDSDKKLQNNSEIVLYKFSESNIKTRISVSASRITKPVIKYFVECGDNSLFPMFMSNVKVPLKYRQPGFYEIKEHGFEYRSLPFTQDVFDHIVEVVYSSFKLFDEI